MAHDQPTRGHGFGTAPVFLAAISTILGAVLFLRFGYAVGHVGVLGALAIILIGHAITIPAGLAVVHRDDGDHGVRSRYGRACGVVREYGACAGERHDAEPRFVPRGHGNDRLIGPAVGHRMTGEEP